jgi:Ca2+-binding RTX toxin-like protein
VLAKTRQITVIIKATRGTGAHNNGYADNLSLTLDVDPTAVNDAATVGVNAGPTAVNVLANDTNPDGGPKQVASVTQPTHGTVAITAGGSGLTYNPTPGFCNSQTGGTADTFTYTLNGGSTASVAMTVTCAPGAPPPAVTTGGATSVLPGTATLSGVVNPQGSSTDYHFEYGTSAAYGSSTPSVNAGAGTADVAVSAPLSGLASSTVYHYRLVATSPAGTTLGVDREFESAVITCGSLPAPPSKAVAGPQVTAAATLTGTADANTITGTVGSDRIAALAGNDCVLGLGGNDTIDAGSGDDLVDGDGMCPRAVTFCIPGNAGNDIVTGGSGDDIINGSGGTDRLSGQAGNDRIRGQSGNDRVIGGSGRDILSGLAGSDSLSGGSSDDTLRGGAGHDAISPGAGNDRVNGGSGGDTINARDGERDRVDCGSGRDRVYADRTDRVASNCERVTRR